VKIYFDNLVSPEDEVALGIGNCELFSLSEQQIQIRKISSHVA